MNRTAPLRRCSGKTGAGAACRRTTTNPSGKCPDHRASLATTTAAAAGTVNVDPMTDPTAFLAAYNDRMDAHIREELAAWDRHEAVDDADRAARQKVDRARAARERHREAVGATGIIARHLRSSAVVAWAHGADHPGGQGDHDLVALADDLDIWASQPTGTNPVNGAAIVGATLTPDQSAARRALHAATDPTGDRHRLRAAEAARGIRTVVLDAAAGRNAHRWDSAGTVDAMNAELPVVLGRPATLEDMAMYRMRLAARNDTHLPVADLLHGLPL